jgi:type II secretory pathway component PulF
MNDATPTVKTQAAAFAPPLVGFGLSVEEKGRLAQFLGGLTSAELPLPELLEAMAEEAPDKTQRTALKRLAGAIAAGKSLPDALEPVLDSSSPSLTGLTKVVLKTRDPAATLFRILEYRRERSDFIRNFWLSLTYPIVLFLVTALMAGIVLRIVGTLVAPIFVDFGIDLPIVTRLITNLAERTNSLGWLGMLLPGLVAASLFLMLTIRLNGALGYWPDLAMICRTLADLLDSDCPLPESLKICGVTIGGRLGSALDDMSVQVREGMPLADAFETQAAMPLGLDALVRWSESAGGGASEGLKVAAAIYEAAVRSKARLWAAVLTVFIITSVAWMIFLFVVGLYLPLLQLTSRLSG